MLARREVELEIDSAFSVAGEILRMFSQQSAQAFHYVEILTMLSDVINEQRQKLASSKNRSQSRYVGRIFSLERPNPASCLNSRADINLYETSPSSTASRNSGILEPMIQSDPFLPLRMQQGLGDEPFPGWDNLYLPLWDSFPLIDEPYSTAT
jgi:hypothetical protein